jgi:hypothetical protein
MEDELARTARKKHGDEHDGHSAPAPPPKDQKDRKVKGGKTMRLLCYADDPREPELIGEATVDLAEVLSKGETDGESAFQRLALVCRRLQSASLTATATFPFEMLFRMVYIDAQGQILWRDLFRTNVLVKRRSQVLITLVLLSNICLG